VKVATETITPVKAAEYLGKNANNRNLQANRVAGLAAAIRRGDWVLNGEAIKFNGKGNLLDGQHRLAAIISANLPVETLVVRDAPNEALDTIDTGKTRNVGDVLKLRGESNGAHLASALRLLGQWKIGKPTNSNALIADGWSPQYAERLLREHPSVRDDVSVAGAMANRHAEAAFPSTITAFTMHLFGAISADARDDFFLGWVEDSSGPLAVLRKTLVKDKMTAPHASSGRRIGRYAKLAFVIKAWNYWHDGVSPSRYIWRGNEAMPAPVGDGPPWVDWAIPAGK
jgi:hypothetical protein